MLTIGEFARLGSVSVRMLRHWDSIGLLVPVRVDPQTGYRYYSVKQLARLNSIVVLRDLGFGLDDTSTMVSEISVEQMQALLKNRQHDLDAEIAQRRTQLLRVKARLDALNRYGTMLDYEVDLKPLPAIRFAGIKTKLDGFGYRNVAPVLAPLFKQLALVMMPDNTPSVAHRFICYSGSLDEDNLHAYACQPVTDSTHTIAEPARLYELPQVPHALSTLRHLNDMQNYSSVYNALSQWAKDNDWQTLGAGRDVIINGPDCSEFVMETQWPVYRCDQPGQRPSIEIVPLSL